MKHDTETLGFKENKQDNETGESNNTWVWAKDFKKCSSVTAFFKCFWDGVPSRGYAGNSQIKEMDQ